MKRHDALRLDSLLADEHLCTLGGATRHILNLLGLGRAQRQGQEHLGDILVHAVEAAWRGEHLMKVVRGLVTLPLLIPEHRSTHALVHGPGDGYKRIFGYLGHGVGHIRCRRRAPLIVELLDAQQLTIEPLMLGEVLHKRLAQRLLVAV